MKKIIVTILFTFLVLLFVVFAMGGGHGYFWPAKVVYPYSMIIAVLNNQIGIIAIILAVVQIPLYAFINSRKPKWMPFIIIVHIIAAIICLYLPTETFDL